MLHSLHGCSCRSGKSSASSSTTCFGTCTVHAPKQVVELLADAVHVYNSWFIVPIVSDMLLVKELSKSHTFLLLVLIMNSLARWGAGCGSRGRITMLLSSGSPGTIYRREYIKLFIPKRYESMIILRMSILY